ncbi:MAG: Nramp family divalent metal transporter, partial [Candidatus Hydrogenedentota bacterium]
SVTLMVVIITGGLIVVAFTVGNLSDTLTFSSGLLNVGHISLSEDFTGAKLFGAVVFAGAGGFGNLFYAYYLREKGIGMGQRMPAMTSVLRRKEAAGAESGFLFRDTAENIRRFRDWLWYVVLDNTLYFWLLNTFTMMLFMYGSFVALHVKGVVPSEANIVWDLAVILEDSLPGGRYLYLVIALSALFSTQLTFSDGTARLWTDLFHLNFKFARRWAANQWYLFFLLALSILGIVSTWFFETYDVSSLDFFFLNAVGNGFAMALYTPLLLYMNFKLLPASARPGPFNVLMMVIASATYLSFAAYVTYDKLIGF